jgi:hypothetical protein
MRPTPGMGGRGIKENDELNLIEYIVRTFVNFAMYSQYNNK